MIMSLSNQCSPEICGLQEVCYKAAISLNNTAVLLLTRGYCHEAAAIFSDSINAMSLSAQTMAPTPNDDKRIRQQVRLLLMRATTIQSASTRHPRSTKREAMQKSPILRVISNQHSPAKMHATLTAHSIAVVLHYAFLVTIDPIDFEPYTIDDARLQLGVVMHNYGIALNCIVGTNAASVVATSGKTCHDPIRHNNARDIFRAAGTLLFEIECSTRVKQSPFLRNQILLLQIVLTHNLLYVSIKQRKQFEFNVYCCSMQRLLRSAKTQHSHFPMTDYCVAAAA
jgi:hypothetical protein